MELPAIAQSAVDDIESQETEEEPKEQSENFEDSDDLALEFDFLESVVTASKTKQSVMEAPSIIAVITREQILQRNYHSVAQALISLPGIYLNYDYVFYDVGLRGINGGLRGGSRLIKVMINGQSVSFRNETTNFMGAELIPMESIERIEVIRGPGSALYGANAFLGVVNIITRSGKSINGMSISLSPSLFQEAYGGLTFGMTFGQELGPVDLVLSFSHGSNERSGLGIRCTADLPGEQPCQTVTPVTKRVMQLASFDDLAQPSSLLASMELDLNKLFSAGDSDLGKISILGNLQMLDSRGSFSDWGTLTYDTREQDGKFYGIPNTGNRIALYNSFIRGRYQIGFLENLLDFNVGVTYAKGGAMDSERLKDIYGYKDRSPYGYHAVDVFSELQLNYTFNNNPIGSQSDAPTEPGRAWVKDIHFLLGADWNEDLLTFVANAGAKEGKWASRSLHNIGVWLQGNGGFLDGSLGLTTGLRYDIHDGTEPSQKSISTMTEEEKERLCDLRVCYDQLSYRIGATLQILKLLELFGTEQEEPDPMMSQLMGEETQAAVVSELFIKILWGTAFKAPSPIFLYDDGFLGERPLNPNPALLPQLVESLEIQVGSSFLYEMLDVSLTFFHNDLSNKAEFDRQGLAVVSRNEVPIETWGIESSLRFRLPPLTVYGSVSYQKSQKQLGENLEQRIETTFGYPNLMATAGVSVLIEWIKMVANIELRYVGERVGSPFNRSDRAYDEYFLAPYLLLDLNLVSHQWKFLNDKETRVGFSIRNLLNSSYDYPGYQPYYRYDVPGEPRILLVQISQEF